MAFDFLIPISKEIADYKDYLSKHQIGGVVQMHTPKSFPDLDQVKMAIIGVLENRGNANDYSQVDLTLVRKSLYALHLGNWNIGLADLGDIIPGDTITDTYFALKKVVASLIKKGIVPIVIGGSQDLTYAMYRSFDELEQMVNVVAIDSKFDFGKESDELSSESYLSKMILDAPNNLFNFCNIGFQTYYNSQEEIDLIEKLYFDAYRLGEISNNIALSEPVFRDADMVSLDLTSVKSSDSGNFSHFVPNGFNGKEICALARYAGISDKVSLFGIFNHDSTATEAVLIAQIIWYFLEGYQYRSGEYPFGTKENYIKYIVPLEEEELVFYKSHKTDRWWIEIPFLSPSNNKLKRNTLLPCSYDEYLAACNQIVPERWWKAQRKNCV